jgi:hypothetical protein
LSGSNDPNAGRLVRIVDDTIAIKADGFAFQEWFFTAVRHTSSTTFSNRMRSVRAAVRGDGVLFGALGFRIAFVSSSASGSLLLFIARVLERL